MINHLVLKLQRKYNKNAPIIYNTYQAYLTYSKRRIDHDLERAKREGFYFAGKLVRGAYMVQERNLALEHNKPSPVFETKAETDENYDACANLILENLATSSLLLASHNQNSVDLVLNRMEA
jgi:proline dehydrogenase